MISALMVLSLISVMATVPVAQASLNRVEIVVSGTSGLTFIGSIAHLGDVNSVEDYIPASYTVMVPSGEAVAAVFQKMEEWGTLTVQFVTDGVVIASDTTDEAYGVVAVSYYFEPEEPPPPPPPPANQPPVADAGPDHRAHIGESVRFDGGGSHDPDGTIVSYSWLFGDGITGTGVETTHAYSVAGEYTVTLTVTDDDGATGSDTSTVTVMTLEESAENLAAMSPASAARVSENLPPENAAKIIDAGVKAGLIESMASILNEMDTELAADLLKAIYDLPETPEVAAGLLGAMSLERSVAVVQTLIEQGAFGYVDSMFKHLTDERLNDIYEELTTTQRGELYPHLSFEVVDRISVNLLPRFEASNLVISKAEAEPRESTTISVDMTNTGGTWGTHTVEFRVDGALVDSEDVTVSPAQTKTISFTLSRGEEGTYQITVDGLTGSLEVRKPFPWVPVLVVITIVIIIVAIGAIWYWRRRG